MEVFKATEDDVKSGRLSSLDEVPRYSGAFFMADLNELVTPGQHGRAHWSGRQRLDIPGNGNNYGKEREQESSCRVRKDLSSKQEGEHILKDMKKVNAGCNHPVVFSLRIS